MRSAWHYYRKSIISLEDAIFNYRKLCQKCGEKFLRQKFGTPIPTPEVANGNDFHAQEDAAPAEETGNPAGANVGGSEPDYPVG
ncbi:MAG: hypothetical protein VF00_C0004G0011 [candidate division Kazan bacterium GW2011_GWB1_52_7]|uniref:Uncharacterized protein n=1 Tax=candidate division Kazan bacterium GW2011_GWB1_52_7 TaxID=1620414 RepID=A0A0G1ZFB9_UNCK3|nr:MAG: hypothetical protein VF00_C0004G0011 [candidate division Kazan bacterium GW2011_GWB1_52_7]